MYRRKKYYEDEYNFDMDKINFILVSGSLSIEESTALSRNSVGILRRDVIPKCDIHGLYGMASILERLGKPIKRGKKFPARRWLCTACLNMRNWDGKFKNIFNIFNVLFSFLWRIFELISFVAMALREFHLYFVI